MNPNIQFSDKKLTFQNGKLWFNAGVAYFKAIKHFWYISCLLMVVFFLLLANISPTLLTVMAIFASPLITAFMMKCCDATRTGTLLNFAGLWQTVFKRLQLFLVLGLISAALSVVLHFIHIQLLATFNLSVELTPDMIQNMSGSEALIRTVLNILTNIPIALALAFSPALILFKSADAITAIKFSVQGVLRAWSAFIALMLLIMLVVFALMLLATVVVSVLTVILGPSSQAFTTVLVMFFVLTVVGVGLCAQYAAYQEVFLHESDDSKPEEAEVYAEI